MKIGDLVKSVSNKNHRILGYGFVIEEKSNTNHVNVFWLRYAGTMNPRWMQTYYLEKVE